MVVLPFNRIIGRFFNRSRIVAVDSTSIPAGCAPISSVWKENIVIIYCPSSTGGRVGSGGTVGFAVGVGVAVGVADGLADGDADGDADGYGMVDGVGVTVGAISSGSMVVCAPAASSTGVPLMVTHTGMSLALLSNRMVSSAPW